MENGAVVRKTGESGGLWERSGILRRRTRGVLESEVEFLLGRGWGSPGTGGVLEVIRVRRGCWFLVDSNSREEFQGSREGEGERDLGVGH